MASSLGHYIKKYIDELSCATQIIFRSGKNKGAGMVIVFRCSPEAKEALNELKERGGFGDYSDVINAALVNYAVPRGKYRQTTGPRRSCTRRQTS
jgi:hypothetical protein